MKIVELVKRRAREIFDERLRITDMDAELKMELFDAANRMGILAIWPDNTKHIGLSDIDPTSITDAELNDKIAEIINRLKSWREDNK